MSAISIDLKCPTGHQIASEDLEAASRLCVGILTGIDNLQEMLEIIKVRWEVKLRSRTPTPTIEVILNIGEKKKVRFECRSMADDWFDREAFQLVEAQIILDIQGKYEEALEEATARLARLPRPKYRR